MTIADKLLQLKTDFDDVYNSGANKGHTEGYTEGKAEGHTEGYTEGKAEGYRDAVLPFKPLLVQSQLSMIVGRNDYGEDKNYYSFEDSTVSGVFDDFCKIEISVSNDNTHLVIHNENPLVDIKVYMRRFSSNGYSIGKYTVKASEKKEIVFTNYDSYTIDGVKWLYDISNLSN